MIRASAGTGKTWQLTTRYLRLLMDGVQPERILALTFTRKAAGEFFEKIFSRLAEAAATPEGAARLSQHLAIDATMTQYREKLSLLLHSLHLLQLSTYDSFFGRIVRSFPFELGLDGVPRLLDGYEKDAAVQGCARNLVETSAPAGDLLPDFWHAYKQATFGRDEKSVNATILSTVNALHGLFLEAPEEGIWNGQPLWPKRRDWQPIAFDFARAAGELQAMLAGVKMTNNQREKTAEFLRQLANWRPPQAMDKPLSNFIEAFFKCYGNLASGTATIGPWGKKFMIPPAIGEICRQVAFAVFDGEICQRRESTLGRHRLLYLFEENYDREVRRNGWLTFADLTRLLADRNLSPLQARVTEAERQLVDYRLDGRFDHWLLDEFQDTSYSQWRAVHELVDEVLQEDPLERSFFAVGDTKQCIYMWRQSDDRLFSQLATHYAGAIKTRQLGTSQRSCQPVLDLVNATFSARMAIDSLFGEDLAERWGGGWENHKPDSRLAEVQGHAAVLYAETEEEESRFETTLRLLKSVEPTKRDLSAAILVRTNEEAVRLHEYLKVAGGPETALSSDVYPGTDNPLGALVESMVTYVAHPGDTLAERHIGMTPGRILFGKPPEFVADTLRQFATFGFEATIRAWILALQQAGHGIDEFTRLRARQILTAAREFDKTGEGSPDKFLSHLRQYAVRSSEGAKGVIPILTIHKAKGLDWDMVILPCLKRNTLLERNEGDSTVDVFRNDEGQIDWIFDLPRRDLLNVEARLAQFDRDRREDGAYEALCLLYVAMTRAKRGLYLITFPAGDSTSPNYYKLLDEALGVENPVSGSIGKENFQIAWQRGDPAWYQTTHLQEEFATEPELHSLPAAEQGEGKRFQRVRPSKTIPIVVRGAHLFKPDEKRGHQLGSEVHRLLEQIDWLTGMGEKDRELVQSLGVNATAEAVQEVLQCVESPTLRQIFKKPATPVLLWREKRFELLQEGRLTSGQIDRVVVHLDGNNNPVSAEIVDFKTDAVSSAADVEQAAVHHSAQLNAYRNALAVTLGLSVGSVTAQLVFTKPGAVHTV
ncbi:MAG: UvrD-helicase domain-containing protein [Opitutaceae bacterium]|nr:UvrD-helicase domain-containing protein [Opitutaceae bacterium]